jgi:membrane fusion protein, multidrug efflux system
LLFASFNMAGNPIFMLLCCLLQPLLRPLIQPFSRLHSSLTRLRRTGAALTWSGALVLLAACSPGEPDAGKGAKAAAPTPEAGYVVMKTESVVLNVELAGRINAFEVAEVRPQVSGIIEQRLFTEGALVKAGQILYRVDPRLYRTAEAEARANLVSAQATRQAAQARADRFRPLAQIEAVSRQDYTDAVATAREADAAVAQNRALLETARINLRLTNVPAPISGRIGRSVVTNGALVTASQAAPLATIQRLDPIFVDIQQSSADLLALRRSLASGAAVPSSADVQLILEDGSDYALTGTLQFAEAVVDQATGSVVLRARFPNPSGLLLPGMFVRAQLSQATAKAAILVPQQAVARDPRGQATVMVIGADDKAMLKTVQTERSIGDKWLVSEGVNPGDRVIVEGLGRIKPGQGVKPVAAASAPAANGPPATAASGAVPGNGRPNP